MPLTIRIYILLIATKLYFTQKFWIYSLFNHIAELVKRSKTLLFVISSLFTFFVNIFTGNVSKYLQLKNKTKQFLVKKKKTSLKAKRKEVR